MATEGIEGIYVETHDWRRTAWSLQAPPKVQQ
jgi:hypothetical protein